MKHKINVKFIFGLFLIFSFAFNTYSMPVFAQDDMEEYDENDENDEYLDENIDPEEDSNNIDLYENEEGVEDSDGLYKFNEITAETFKQISNIEKENTLMKLELERGKLKMDLEKQKAEKKKIALSFEDEQRKRMIEQEEENRTLAELRRKQKKADEEAAAEEKAKKQKEEMNKKLLDKINSADLSNPDDIKALTQLYILTTGKELNIKTEDKRENEKPEVPLEERFAVKSVMGAAGNLIANIENLEKKTTFKVRVGGYLDNWLVKDIKGTSVLLRRDGNIKILNLN